MEHKSWQGLGINLTASKLASSSRVSFLCVCFTQPRLGSCFWYTHVFSEPQLEYSHWTFFREKRSSVRSILGPLKPSSRFVIRRSNLEEYGWPYSKIGSRTSLMKEDFLTIKGLSEWAKKLIEWEEGCVCHRSLGTYLKTQLICYHTLSFLTATHIGHISSNLASMRIFLGCAFIIDTVSGTRSIIKGSFWKDWWLSWPSF